MTWRWTGRQDAALHGRRDARRYKTLHGKVMLYPIEANQGQSRLGGFTAKYANDLFTAGRLEIGDTAGGDAGGTSGSGRSR